MSRARQCRARPARRRGFTLAELLVVVAIVAVFAAVALPALSFQDSKKLDVAAQEVRNALRFAVDAGRSGQYVLVDARTAGRLRLWASNAAGAALTAIDDPLTRRAFDVDVSGGALSAGVGMAPRFMRSGVAHPQLLIGPAGQLQAFDALSVNRGALQAGSGIVLALGAASVTVGINETTGFVTRP